MIKAISGIFRKIKKLWKGEVYSYNYRNFRKRIIQLINYFWMRVYYYLILTPISLILRLSGHYFLNIKPAKSYWVSRKKNIDYHKLY